jgi:IS605 OrfB family transposase
MIADNLNEYIDILSPYDRKLLIKYFRTIKDNDSINLIAKSTHVSERKDLELDDNNSKSERSIPQKTLYMKNNQILNIMYTLLPHFTNPHLVDFTGDSYKIDNNCKEKHLNTLKSSLINNIKLYFREKKKGKELKKVIIPNFKTKNSEYENITSIIFPKTPIDATIDNYIKYKCVEHSKISSQCIQQTRLKVDKAYKSFFATIGINDKPRPPKYLKKDMFNLIFQKDSFKIENGYVRLSVGKESKKFLIDNDPNSNGYIKLKAKPNENRTLKEVEICPKYDGLYFHVNFKYDTEVDECFDEVKINVDEYASMDVGEVNLAAIYIPNTCPLIINGKEIRGVNEKTRHKIQYLDKKGISKTDKKKYRLWHERENKLNNYMHEASAKVVKHLTKHNVKKLIIGYNKNWKRGCNMGKRNNDRFYKVPYRKFIDMLFYKCNDSGINVVEINESYTSKTDALAGEAIKRHNTYLGERVKRGLFKSSVGRTIHGDVNGAINIMRRYQYRHSQSLYSELMQIINKTHRFIASPFKINIVNNLSIKPGYCISGKLIKTGLCHPSSVRIGSTESSTKDTGKRITKVILCTGKLEHRKPSD